MFRWRGGEGRRRAGDSVRRGSVLNVSLSFPVDESELEVESVSEGGGAANGAVQGQKTRERGEEKPTHRLAPPASGLTMIPFFQSSMLLLMYATMLGSENRLSHGISKKPWI